MHIFAFSLPAILSFVFSFQFKILQSVQRFFRNEIYIAAFTAIATIGTAFGNKFLTPKAETAVAAISRRYFNYCFIDEAQDIMR